MLPPRCEWQHSTTGRLQPSVLRVRTFQRVIIKVAAHFWHGDIIIRPSQTAEQEVCLRDNISILPLWFSEAIQTSFYWLCGSAEWRSDCGPLCRRREMEIAAQAEDACNVCLSAHARVSFAVIQAEQSLLNPASFSEQTLIHPVCFPPRNKLPLTDVQKTAN